MSPSTVPHLQTMHGPTLGSGLAFCGSSAPSDQALIDKILSEYGEENFADVFLTAKGLDWAADLLTEFSRKESFK